MQGSRVLFLKTDASSLEITMTLSLENDKFFENEKFL